MRVHSNASGRSRRFVLGMTMLAAVAATLAACSSSSSTTTPPPSAPAATTPATSAPASTSAPAAGALSGKWSGMYSGAYSGSFILNWTQSGSKLSGTIQLSNPGDTLPIHGTVNGNAISFGTVGSTAITYTGTVTGNSSMSGTYQVQGGNGSSGGPWSATKS